LIKLFKKYKSEIEKYCEENNIDSNKVFYSAKSFNDKMAFIQYIDPDYKMGDQWDDVPAPVLLAIYDKGGKLEFEQTELTYKYLSKRG
jgi:hypothetical protein